MVKIGKNTEDVVEKLADYIDKCDVSGKAQCFYCDDAISYGSRGCVGNYSLGSAFVIEIPTTSPAGLSAGELTEHLNVLIFLFGWEIIHLHTGDSSPKISKKCPSLGG